MANDNPPPLDGSPTVDPSQVEVLLASNIAADDLLWVVRASVQELHKLFEAPVPWVASLSALPGWIDAVTREPAPPPVLTDDFGLTVEPSDREDPNGWVVVQGIGGTNQLTVSASRASGIRSLLAMDAIAEAVARTLGRSVGDAQGLSDAELLEAGTAPFGPFWDLVSTYPGDAAKKKTLTVDVILAISRFYAHFEILDRGETPRERAQRTCSFLCATVFDPVGEAEMYNGLDQETLDVRGDRGEPGRRVVFRPATAPKGFYANIEGDEDGAGPETEEEDGPDPICICVSFNGPYRASAESDGDTEGTIEGGMLKRWGIECTYPPG